MSLKFFYTKYFVIEYAINPQFVQGNWKDNDLYKLQVWLHPISEDHTDKLQLYEFAIDYE